MSDIAECRDLLRRYTAARIPFVTIDTLERMRVLDVLREVAEEHRLTIYVHTLSQGTYDLLSGRTVNDDKSVFGALDFFGEEMTRRDDLTLLITEPPDLSDDNADVRQMMDLVLLANEHGGSIMCLADAGVWTQLRRMGMHLSFDLPDEDEMYEILKDYIDDYRNSIRIEWDDEDVREAASLLTGVTQIEAENVIAALIANKQILKSDMDEVRSAKNRLFSDISGLEKINIDDGVGEVGGLAGLRSWLDEKRELLRPEKRAQLKAVGLNPPRGILLVGVPGCGKSLSAKAIAQSWRLPLYRLDFATVQGSYVGQSEKQLKEALSTAEEVSPCVLWIDEIEKGLAGSTGDGGVSTRMVGQFLFWLQECRKQVFVVATANDVSMLPSELLRRGRFDELFFVDLPSAAERQEILSLYFRKYLELDFSGPLADQIVNQTDGFTGADLESTVRDIAYRVVANPEFVLSEDAIQSAFENVVPLSQTSPEKIEAIRDWGKERAVPASGKPIGSDRLPETRASRVRRVLV